MFSRRALPPLVAAGIALLSVGLHALHAAGIIAVPGLTRAELAAVDARFTLRGPRPLRTQDIVIVALDERTRAEAPDLFQKRAGWARLLAALARYRPAAIGIDGYFASPEITLPAEVVAQAKAARAALAAEPASAASAAAISAFDAVIEETRGDDKLARAVGDAGVVWLGALLFLDGEPAAADAPEPAPLRPARFDEVAAGAARASRRPPRAADFATVALPEVAARAAGAGLLNVDLDEDGAVRGGYLVLERAGRFYLPLALALARRKLGVEATYVVGDDHVGLGRLDLPVDARGRARFDFLGTPFPRLSAADVASGRVPPDALAGKIVFVGYTDAARDKFVTPFDPLFPGVEIHATLLHNALYGELVRRLGPWGDVGALAALCALLTLLQLVGARRPLAGVVAGMLLLGGYLAAAQLLFGQRVELPVAAPLVGGILVTLAGIGTAVVVEGREKAHIRAAFSQYLDDKAVRQILSDPSRLALGGERRELTVLFSDIRGFTQLAEDLDPLKLIEFLNAYLTPMTELVWSAGGMLDKYIGDALMAVYGAPLEQTDHAVRACRTALEMQRRLAELNDAWRASGLGSIVVGIGVNSGAMSVGNMGSARRKNYTVVGDAVNQASRLEGLTKEYGAPILCGERTYALARDKFVFREIDRVRLKGRDQAERVYELLGEAPGADASAYERALAAYRVRDWDAAEAGLDAIIAERPDDGPARVLRERVRRLREAPPGEGWDGVYDQAGK
jgi:adenylate cyclase